VQTIFYSFAIDCHGDVFPCNSFLYKVGNIYENSVEDIWLRSEALEELKQIKNSDLKSCLGCNYKKYCERCPGMALLEKGDFKGCDSYAKTVAEIRNRKL
jgi:radical SAM protein with 4Fe4S-binding SPASM domain